MAVVDPPALRRRLKSALARTGRDVPAAGASLLIYHRIGGGTPDELDLSLADFERQLDVLAGHDVVHLDAALDRLDAGDTSPSVVLTFDDGFDDVHVNAWPLLRERGLPFTVYLASGFVGRTMVWEGSTAKGESGRGMTWDQIGELVDSGQCTIGNHTHDHVRPEVLTEADLDACTDAIERELGVAPRHFTYPWGIPVPAMEPHLRTRFRSASTGELGRNHPDTNRVRLARVPVRRSDPPDFFAAKLTGSLGPERVYATAVRLGKAAGLRG